MSKTHKVFCYGSLKRGYGNHVLLETSDFIQEDETVQEDLCLMDFGPYPGVYEKGDTSVKGEVYEVTDETFSRLDCLEGYPNYYDRKEVPLRSGVTAWMYYLKGEEPRGIKCPDGLWLGGGRYYAV